MSHLIGKQRKFGSEFYVARASRKLKSDAKKYATRKRKQGWKARVVPAKHKGKGKEYYIYLKRK